MASDGDDPTLFDEITDGLDVEGEEQARRWNAGSARVRDISEQHFRRGGVPWETTTPCPGCGGHDGRLIRHPDDKHIVRCVNPACRMIIAQLSKAEVEGRRPTAQDLRRKMSPEKKASIFQRDGMACVFCRRSDRPLHIGHLLSLADAADLGVDAAIANHDANLGAMCQECYEGQAAQAARSIWPRTYAVIMWRLLQTDLAQRSHPPNQEHPLQT